METEIERNRLTFEITREIFSKIQNYIEKFKMAALTKNDISVTVRDRAKRTKIWDYKDYNSLITNIFKNSKFYKKKFKMAALTKNAISVTVRNKIKKYFSKIQNFRKKIRNGRLEQKFLSRKQLEIEQSG